MGIVRQLLIARRAREMFRVVSLTFEIWVTVIHRRHIRPVRDDVDMRFPSAMRIVISIATSAVRQYLTPIFNILHPYLFSHISEGCLCSGVLGSAGGIEKVQDCSEEAGVHFAQPERIIVVETPCIAILLIISHQEPWPTRLV